MKFWSLRVCLLTALVFVYSASVRAEDAAKQDPGLVTPTPPAVQEKPAEEKDTQATLKPGIIASIGTRPGNAASAVNSGSDAPGDEQLPVAASVKRIERDSCEVKITNNHEKNTYSLNYAVEGTDAKGAVLSKNTFTSTLKPKQSTTKNITCREGLNMQVTLRSGKKA